MGEDPLKFRGRDRRGTARAGAVSGDISAADLLNRLIGNGWQNVIIERNGAEVGRAGTFDYTGEYVCWAET